MQVVMQAKISLHKFCYNLKLSLLIRVNCFLSASIYRCSIPNNLNMKELRFKRQKSLFSLVFQAQNRTFFHSFLLNQAQRENSLFPSEVHLFSICCEGTKISGIFTNCCQLKARCSHGDFAAKRKKQVVSLVDFGKSVGLFGEAISFLPSVQTLL